MKLNVTRWICGVLCLLGFVFPVTDASAGVVTNDFYDLNDTAAPIEPPPGWSIQPGSGGIRHGRTIIAPTGGDRFYIRTDDIAGEKAWLIEAVLSSNGLGFMGETGARMWAQFEDPDLFNLPPPGVRKYYRMELRLMEDGAGTRRLSLCDANAIPVTEKASLNLNWANQQPRLRVRLKRQQTAGGDYIVIQGEASRTGTLPTDPPNWDDPLNPNPDPDTANSQKVLLSDFLWSTSGTTNEFGFGHTNNGTFNDVSVWEHIHVTVADDATTVLPYWPPTPSTPILTHDDKGMGNPQGIDLSADLTTGGYLINDSAIAELDADGTTYFGDTRVNPGVEVWDFDNLGDNQTVYGRMAVSDVSGRSTTGSDGSAVIPSRTAIPTLSEWGMIIFALLLLTAGLVAIRRRQGQ